MTMITQLSSLLLSPVILDECFFYVRQGSIFFDRKNGNKIKNVNYHNCSLHSHLEKFFLLIICWKQEDIVSKILISSNSK